MYPSGVIPFRRKFLLHYNELKQTQLEIIESVDMMRVLENGYQIKMVYISEENFSVDTERDLKNVMNIMIYAMVLFMMLKIKKQYLNQIYQKRKTL